MSHPHREKLDEETLRKKEKLNDQFDRKEMGALLKLFSALGITVAFGITVFFVGGLYLDRTLANMGVQTHGLPRIIGVLLGVGLSIYWAYLRIGRHLDRYAKEDEREEQKPSDRNE